MMNRADKASLLPVQKIHSLAGIYTGVCRYTCISYYLIDASHVHVIVHG